ncbi:MAG: SpoIIE family protein phosphatase [Clostridia bacterium]|nr:SpoIIE family protein phosphatase [Clostridia bacterium]
MQNRLRSDPSTPLRGRASPLGAPTRDRGLRILGELARGAVFGGAAFLLGSCPLLFGAAPLGLALLAASSSYTWYILAGLLLSAALHPVTLAGWAWVGVYLLCLILRLVVRFFVDPPALPDGTPCRGRTYLLLCWVSFKRNLGLVEDASSAGDTETDYYGGKDTPDTVKRDKPPRMDYQGLPVRLFAEHPFLRMLTAGVCGLAAGLSAVITGGFHVYDLLCALCMLVIPPAVCFLLVSCFGESGLTLLFSPKPLRGSAALRGSDLTEEDGGAVKVWRKFHALPLVSVCVLIAATVFAARGFRIPLGTALLGIEIATLLGLVLTLFASSRLGVVPGVAVGVICGLSAEPRLAPMFILCAGCYALLRYVSHRSGVLGGCAVGAGWCALVEGVAVLTAQIPAILLTIPLFFLTERLWLALPHGQRFEKADRELEEFTAAVTASLTAESRAEAQRARMKALSEAFGALSQRFYDLSSQLKRPRMLDLRRICDESFGKKCARCKDRDICWGSEYERTLEAQTRLASQLHTGGKASAESLPDSLRDFCPYMEEIVTDINGRCARMTEILLKSEKTEVFAADYAAIASLLSDALEEDRRAEEDFACNREAADRVYDYLTEAGVTVQGVVVGGKRGSGRQRVIVRGVGFEAVADKLPEVRARIGEMVGCPMTAPAFDEGEDGGASAVMTLHSEAKLRVAYSGSTLPADHPASAPLPSPLTHETPAGAYDPPAVCGDHIALFKNGDAYFYALISDGMGSGEDASLTSDICAMFLEKMLAAGNRAEVSLRMLDGYIRSKNTGTGDECSATVDLMELDLMDGRAVFAKNGAAPTYVVREGSVYKLHAPTMPIGIVKDTPPRLLKFRTHPGDVVVMVSDGVTLGNDECPWLIDLLSSPMPDSMDALRRDIIKRALTAGSEDDLSAIAIRVEER